MMLLKIAVFILCFKFIMKKIEEKNINYITEILIRLDCLDFSSNKNKDILQGKVFLLKYLGVDLGFDFNWYVSGPSSKNLKNTALYISIFGKRANLRLRKRVLKAIETVNTFEENDPFKNPVIWYSLLASVAYWQLNGLSKIEIIEKIGNHYELKFIEKAFEVLLV